MDYEFLNSSINREKIILPDSDKINPFLLRNNYAEILKAVDFLDSKEKFLYLHGFLGTGKRQFVNYVTDFLSNDVIKLEYYCKEATVCDDILLSFIDVIDNNAISKAVNLNAKITTLGVKFRQYISSIKKPFLIILHSLDDVAADNMKLISDMISDVLKEENVKLIISTRAMMPSVINGVQEDRKIFLKAFTKEVFQDFLTSNQIQATDTAIDDFYKYTRGYYYYTALSVKIIQAMKISLHDFLQKFAMSGISFDSYLGITYVNLVPTAIRNFFWFLRTIRHGISLNALAVFEIYDEFSIEYLKTNLMIFQSGENIYVQDYFLQKIDISIPAKTEIKLHKYIIGIYEAQIKEPLKQRALLLSRQALRAEIEYHSKCIYELEHGEEKQEPVPENTPVQIEEPAKPQNKSLSDEMKTAEELSGDKKYTEAIEAYKNILAKEGIDTQTIIEVRLHLARLYKEINNLSMSAHFYDIVESYYKQHNELINLNYLYYEMTDLYFKMYKNQRAVETAKKVIYSVDTPQSLMVSACTLLGNIYSSMNNPDEAYSYYQKALASLDDNTEPQTLAELYFKYALACDDRGEMEQAFKYYNRCIAVPVENPYKSLAYSNLASCYYENGTQDEAKDCFLKAYNLDKASNNYDGIYYNASHLAELDAEKRLDYLLEAKRSAEFINEDFYILESTIALGDYYYNNPDKYKDALKEYFKARKTAANLEGTVDAARIESRINDMKLRMKPEEYTEIEKKYGN